MRLTSNLRVGLTYGLAASLIYSAFATVLYLFSSSSEFNDTGTSLGDVVSLYLVAGVLGGCIYPIVAPLGRWRAGSAVVGTIVTFPVFLGVMILLPDVSLSGSEGWISAFGCAAIIGGLGAVSIWEPR